MYKTIVVHVDQTDRAVQRIALAIRLAEKYEAHLVGTAFTGFSPYVFPLGGFDMAPPPVPFSIDDYRSEADKALKVFDAQVRAAGMASFESRRIDDQPGTGLAMQSRYCDLTIIGLAGANEPVPRVRSDFPEYVLLNSISPVLVLPTAAQPQDIGAKITVAWNGSPNAARAVMSAIPLLKSATQVDLVVFDAYSEGDLHGEQAGADMALYLARHGIKVDLTAGDATGDTGNAILAHAAARGSDMVVMGAFGHSRFRELVFGGATRTMLSASTLPLWMAH